jgi:hypothetical protein
MLILVNDIYDVRISVIEGHSRGSSIEAARGRDI